MATPNKDELKWRKSEVKRSFSQTSSLPRSPHLSNSATMQKKTSILREGLNNVLKKRELKEKLSLLDREQAQANETLPDDTEADRRFEQALEDWTTYLLSDDTEDTEVFLANNEADSTMTAKGANGQGASGHVEVHAVTPDRKTGDKGGSTSYESFESAVRTSSIVRTSSAVHSETNSTTSDDWW